MATPPNNRIGAGFTEGELQFASIWIRNRAMLRNLLWGFLIAINVGLWGFSLWGLLDAYVLSWPRESRMNREISENAFVALSLQSNRPEGIQTRAVSVFQGTEDRLDMIVPVYNPNEVWWASFTYRFNVSGELTDAQSGFLLPGERTYLGVFGYLPEKAGGRSAVLTVDNVQWHRVDPRQVGANYEEWVSARNGFEYKDVAFEQDLVIGGRRVSRTSFDLANTSAYGYWNLGLIVVLKRNEAPIAATYTTLDKLKAGETRSVNIDWFETLPAATETEIVPHVNYLDDSVYLPTSYIR